MRPLIIPTQMHNLGQWDELADALRDELAEYGGLLSLLEEQRAAIARGKVDELLQTNLLVQEQTAAAVHYKDVREEVTHRIAGNCGCSPKTSVSNLLAFMPPEARAMFESLIDEGKNVTTKARERAGRNEALLAKAAEVNEKLLSALRPQATMKTYNARGSVSVRSRYSGSVDFSA